MSHYTIMTPLGNMGITFHNEKLIGLSLQPKISETKTPQEALATPVINQLLTYFQNPTHTFHVDMELHGSPFQQRVWRALLTIPAGATMTYGALAKQLDTSPRAIGQACRTNPLLIIVPCHRVVAVNHIGGYSGTITGRWLDVKKWLLQHEGVE